MKRFHLSITLSALLLSSATLFPLVTQAVALPAPGYSKQYSPQQQAIINTKGLPEGFNVEYVPNVKKRSIDREEVWKYYSKFTTITFTNGKKIKELPLSSEGNTFSRTPYTPQQFYQPLTTAQITKFASRATKTETLKFPKGRIITTWRDNLETSHNGTSMLRATASAIKGKAPSTTKPSTVQPQQPTVTPPPPPQDNVPPATTPSSASATDPVIQWTFDRVDGNTVIDDSPTKTNGTLNSATIVPAHSGNGVLLNGTNGFVSTAYKPNQGPTSRGLTIDLWVNPTTTNGSGTLLSTDNGGWDWAILRDGNRWMVATGDSAQDTGLKTEAGQWQHLTATFNPTTKSIQFSKDGVVKTIPSLGLETSTSTFTVGRNPSFDNTNFAGIVDDITVYPYAKAMEQSPATDTGVTTLPTRRSDDIVVGPTDATIQWSFENIINTSVIDDSKAGTLGTLHDTTTVTGHSGNGINLDGKKSFISTTYTPNQSSTSRGLTMSIWVKPSGASGGTLLSTDNGGWDWAIYSDGKTWFVGSGDDGRNTTLTVEADQWQHLTAIFDPATKTVRFYKDGQINTVRSFAFDTSTNAFTVGKNPSFGGTNFAGVVDDIVVYPYARDGE